MKFSWQEYWSGWSFASPGDLPDPGIEPASSICRQIDCGWGTSLVAQTVKCLPAMRETWVQSLGPEDPLQKEMATHSSILAWKTPWMEKPGRLQSMGDPQRVGHDWATSLLWSESGGALNTCLGLQEPVWLVCSFSFVSLYPFPLSHWAAATVTFLRTPEHAVFAPESLCSGLKTFPQALMTPFSSHWVLFKCSHLRYLPVKNITCDLLYYI